MRKPAIDSVEIVEPPIGELTRQRGSLKKTCLTGCGCVVFLIIGILVGIRLFVGSGPSTIKTVPDNFPTAIPIYEKDAIDSMTYIPGRYKSRSLEIAAIFPKLILSPLLLTLRHESSPSSTNENLLANKSFWRLLIAPVSDGNDTVEVEWKNMDAEPDFVITFYKKELGKKGYQVSDTSENSGEKQFTFDSGDGVSGLLFVQGNETDHPGTDYASLTVNIPTNYQNK